MKGLLITAAMFAAIGGTAFAQADSSMTPAAPADTAPAASAPVNPPTSTAPAAPADANAPDQSAAGQAAPAMAPAAPMAAPNNAADTSAAVAPQAGDYPICKTRGQDHCQVRSQMNHRHASAQ
jgi:hypothetical protein